MRRNCCTCRGNFWNYSAYVSLQVCRQTSSNLFEPPARKEEMYCKAMVKMDVGRCKMSMRGRRHVNPSTCLARRIHQDDSALRGSRASAKDTKVAITSGLKRNSFDAAYRRPTTALNMAP